MAKKKQFDPFKYCLKLFRVSEENVFCFKDEPSFYALHTKDAKKYILPKDLLLYNKIKGIYGR